MVTKVRTDQLNAAVRVVLRADISQVDRAAWPELLEFAARVVLAAEDGLLRRSLFGEVASDPTLPARSQAFVYGARYASITTAGGHTWTDATRTSAPSRARASSRTSFGDKPLELPRRQRRGLSHGTFLLFACGAVLVLAGVNLLFGPASSLLMTSSAGISPELLGELSLLVGVAAWVWAAAQWAAERSFQAGDSEGNARPAGILRWGLPLASSLVVIALGLSIVAATRPLKNGSAAQPVAVRQAPAAGVPAAALSVRSETAGNQAAATASSDPSLARGSATLIREVARRVTTLARTVDSPTTLTTTALTQPTQPALGSDGAPANSTFARVSGSAVDTIESRSVANPAPSGHIRLGPPPTPLATPRPTAAPARPTAPAQPRLGPAVGSAPGLPPPAPTFLPAPTGTPATHR